MLRHGSEVAGWHMRLRAKQARLPRTLLLLSTAPPQLQKHTSYQPLPSSSTARCHPHLTMMDRAPSGVTRMAGANA